MKGKHLLLKVLHRIYCKLFINESPFRECGIVDPNKAAEIVYNILTADNPCMIARYGSTELLCVCNVLGIRSSLPDLAGYISDRAPQWWWNEKNIEQMKNNAGFFPNTKQNLQKFSDIILEASGYVDVLGTWLTQEKMVKNFLNPDILKVPLVFLDPFWSSIPWTKALEGKRVLVIHPFAEQIERMYKTKRDNLFDNQDILPKFTLLTIKAVQSLGGQCDGYSDWFEALDWMKSEMDKSDYDVALIGCGAYGFPLAAYAKQKGHKAVHLGGSLQLLFGIRGRRWDNPEYAKEELKRKGAYLSLFNDYWEYPDEILKPRTASVVEKACYW